MGIGWPLPGSPTEEHDPIDRARSAADALPTVGGALGGGIGGARRNSRRADYWVPVWAVASEP